MTKFVLGFTSSLYKKKDQRNPLKVYNVEISKLNTNQR